MVTKRAKRWIARGMSVGLVLVAAAFSIATWIQAGTVAPTWLEVSRDTSAGSVVIRSVLPDVIELEAGELAERPGVWGLAFEGGRAVVGQVIGVSDGVVQRTLLGFSGAPRPGIVASLDRAVWTVDDAGSFGFEEAVVDGPNGPLPVWVSEAGAGDTWVVFVHGNGAGPAESLRLASAVSDAGYPALIASYQPVVLEEGEAARHGFGYNEWQDLDAAVDLARGRGATSFVLVGYGSGASIVGVYLYESGTPNDVVAVVLDAPLLSLRTMIHDTWVDQGVPGWTIGWTKALASMRFGIDLAEIDHIERIEEWQAPALILHGRDDDVYPLGLSETFALSKANEALLLTFPGAGYGMSWNVDRERYETAVLGFLSTHAPLFETVPSQTP